MHEIDEKSIVRRKSGEHLRENFLRYPRIIRRSDVSLDAREPLNRSRCVLVKIGQAPFRTPFFGAKFARMVGIGKEAT